MPTNLPPEYFNAEQRFRNAESVSTKIACLEEMLSKVPKHKGTDHLRADLRRKLSKLNAEQHKKKSIGKHSSDYHIPKEGVARLIIVGRPNVGKSSLLAALSHANPQVSSSPYSTWSPMPGMAIVDDIQIQLIDTPPLDAKTSTPELFDLLRTADLIILMLDIQAFPIQQLEDSIALLKKHKIATAGDDEPTANGSMTRIPLLVAVNKDDDESEDEDCAVLRELVDPQWSIVSISVKTERNLEPMIRECFQILDLIRVFSKKPGEEADYHQPYVLKKGSTIEDFAGRVHKDFAESLKSARIWGTNTFDGQMVGRDHILTDGDVVELHM